MYKANSLLLLKYGTIGMVLNTIQTYCNRLPAQEYIRVAPRPTVLSPLAEFRLQEVRRYQLWRLRSFLQESFRELLASVASSYGIKRRSRGSGSALRSFSLSAAFLRCTTEEYNGFRNFPEDSHHGRLVNFERKSGKQAKKYRGGSTTAISFASVCRII